MVNKSLIALALFAGLTATAQAADTFEVGVVRELPGPDPRIVQLPIPQAAVGQSTYVTPFGTVNSNAAAISGGGGIVQGTSANYTTPLNGDGSRYAQPFLSTELGTITATFNNPLKYLGFIWGTVDPQTMMGSPNVLQFFSGMTLVGTVTGDDIYRITGATQPGLNALTMINDANGSFDRIVFSSGTISFEAADFQVSASTIAVPEPATMTLLAGMVGASMFARRRNTAG